MLSRCLKKKKMFFTYWSFFFPCKSVYFCLLRHHVFCRCALYVLYLYLHYIKEALLSSSGSTLLVKPSPQQPRSSCDWPRPAPAAWQASTLWTTSIWRAWMWWRDPWGSACCKTASESSAASTRPLLPSRCVFGCVCWSSWMRYVKNTLSLSYSCFCDGAGEWWGKAFYFSVCQ